MDIAPGPGRQIGSKNKPKKETTLPLREGEDKPARTTRSGKTY